VKITPLIACVLILVVLFNGATYAQPTGDVIRIQFYSVDPVTRRPTRQLDPNDKNLTIKSGDQIRVVLQSTFKAYFYIINVGPGGMTIAYPTQESEIVSLEPGQGISLVFQADNQVGQDALFVITSRDRIVEYDQAIKAKKKDFAITVESLRQSLPQPLRHSLPPAPTPKRGTTTPQEESTWLTILKTVVPLATLAAQLFLGIPSFGFKDLIYVPGSKETFFAVDEAGGRLPEDKRGVLGLVFTHY
jgi:hypothetical protein